MTIVLEPIDDHHQLPTHGTLAELGILERLAGISHHFELTVLQLLENAAHGVVVCISVQDEPTSVDRHCQDRSNDEETFQDLECLLLSSPPFKAHDLLRQLVQQLSYFHK